MTAEISTILINGSNVNMTSLRNWLDAPFMNGPLTLNSQELQGVDSNIGGSTISQDAMLYIEHNVASPDAIVLATANAFPPGIAFRRSSGTLTSPADATAGQQIGYLDFRGWSDGVYRNCASIDAIVDSGIVWSTGDIPPTKIRFATTGTTVTKVGVEIMAEGRLECGAHDGEDYYSPDVLAAESKFYVNTLLNDWSALIACRPATGAGFGLKVYTLGETVNDWFLGCVSGAGTGTEKFSVRGNGVVNALTEYQINGTKVLGAQGAAIADITSTATSGSLPTPDGNVTIANAATPTAVELLEYCVELEAKVEAILARMRAATPSIAT